MQWCVSGLGDSRVIQPGRARRLLRVRCRPRPPESVYASGRRDIAGGRGGASATLSSRARSATRCARCARTKGRSPSWTGRWCPSCRRCRARRYAERLIGRLRPIPV